MTRKEFGKKLRGWRDLNGLHQLDAAKKAGFSQTRWSLLELGEAKRIGLDEARRIVALTGGAITLEDFPEQERAKSDESSTDLSDESLHARAAG